MGEISSRYLLGAFGRGRPLSYDMWGEIRDGQPVLHYANGKPREFYPTGRISGEYTGVPGDYVILQIDAADASWDITEPADGSKFHMALDPSVSGRLIPANILDRNGNRLTFTHTSGRLTGITDANGDTTTYQYNPDNGRITRITAPTGQVADYGYDASGEHLTSIINSRGTTQFTYVAGAGAAREHALASVSNPDGTGMMREYDTEGRLVRVSKDAGAEAVSYSYDDTGGITITDPAGGVQQLFFNRYSQAGRVIDQLGHILEYGYDQNHQLVSVTGEGNIRSTLSYDEQGNRTGMTTPLGATISAAFGDHRSLSKMVDPRGNLTAFNYDANGNLLQVSYPDGNQLKFEFDSRGRTARSINRRGQAIQYSHNSKGKTTQKSIQGGSTVNYSYDDNGRLLSTVDSRGTTSFTYDASDRLIRVNYPGGKYVAYSYDGAGRKSSMTTQDGFNVMYQYNSLGRLAAIRDGSDNQIVSYSYDQAGRISRKDMGNGTYTAYSHNAAGHPLQLVNYSATGTVLSRFEYIYDNRGLVTRMTSIEGNCDYFYDDAGQLVQVTTPDNRVIKYEYDLSGNRTAVADNGTVVNYRANAADQYSAAGNSTFSYDADGNLTSKSTPTGVWNYTYDVENRLVGVTGPSTAISYEYDPMGNRIATVENGVRREYLYDMADLIGEYDGAGGLIAHYSHGIGLASRLSAAGAASYYHFDAASGTTQLTSATGTLQNSYSYLPYGERLTTNETVANPFTYAGEFGVMDDRSSGLYFMRNRFYDPAQGRFTQPDPIGLSSGEKNLYRYAGNRPNMNIDPSGLIFGGLFDISMIPTDMPGSLDEAIAQYGSEEAAVQHYMPMIQQLMAANAQQASTLHANTQLVLNHPYSQLPFHYYQQGNIGAAYASAAAVVVSMFTGHGSFAEHSDHFNDIWTQYSTVFTTHQSNAVNDPHVVAAVNALQADFYSYLNQQCNNPPSPPHGPCNKVTSGNAGKVLAKFGSTGAVICESMPPTGGGSTSVVSSYDPNVKITVGFGDQGYIPANVPITYTIFFENKDTATAAAQMVTVTDQLSANLDWPSMQLISYGFNNTNIDIPGGLQTYTGQVEVATDPNPVKVNATLNPATGLITWTMESIDPVTGGVPEDPYAGFLPPNDATHRGEGYVTFSIKPKPGLADGTDFTNKALIVFDVNAPIDTNVVINTIDLTNPTSNVGTLPAASPADFTVSWGGDDSGGSGIAAYDVYVKTDNGAYVPWLTGTTATSATFAGTIGHTYSFYSYSTDNVGHRQVQASSAVTTITSNTKAGDCDFNGIVTIAEVQSGINMFLGLKTAEACVDQDAVGGVSIAEVQKVINSFLGL